MACLKLSIVASLDGAAVLAVVLQSDNSAGMVLLSVFFLLHANITINARTGIANIIFLILSQFLLVFLIVLIAATLS